jgi:hypothetical protein
MQALDRYVEMLEDLEPGDICRLGLIVVEREATGYIAWLATGDGHVLVPESRHEDAGVCFSRAQQYRLTGAIAR